MKGKKMKPVKAWALVYESGDMRPMHAVTFPMYKTREHARGIKETLHGQYGTITRIARVVIREA